MSKTTQKLIIIILLVLLVISIGLILSIKRTFYYQLAICPVDHPEFYQEGIASWYNYDLPHLPDYSKKYRTCASRDYPRETILIVVSGERFTTVRVNDYGPAASTGRVIDLSSQAFKDLAPLSKGLIEVKVKIK